MLDFVEEPVGRAVGQILSSVVDHSLLFVFGAQNLLLVIDLLAWLVVVHWVQIRIKTSGEDEDYIFLISPNEL